MPQDAIVDIQRVSFQYPGAAVASLHEVSVTAHRGDRILVIGHNGCGKSTLLSLLAGRRKPQQGHVRVLGCDPFDDTSMTQDIALVGAPWPAEAVFGNTVDRIASPASDPERKKRLAAALHLRLSRFVDKMSSGEKRRVQLLHGMLSPATIYLLDECSTDLDMAERRTVLDLVRSECAANQGCCFYATHILDRVQGWATHLLMMEGGRVVDFKAVEDIVMPLEEYAFLFMSKQGGVPAAVRCDGATQSLPHRSPPLLTYGKFMVVSPATQTAGAAGTSSTVVDGDVLARGSSSPTQSYWGGHPRGSGGDRPEVVIDCNHLTYKNIFTDMSFRIFRGDRALLCGANGAGKSTLLNMLGGKQFFDNRDGALSVLGKRCYDDMLLNGLVSYGGDWWTSVPGGEVHVWQMVQLRTPRAEKLRELLAVQMDWDVRHISAGEQKRVQLLLYLLEDKPVVLLDEATADLDVDQRHSLLHFLYEESVHRGVTVVYSTHIFGGLEGWADTVVLLDRSIRGVHAVWRASDEQPISLDAVVSEMVALKAREEF